MRSLVGVVVVTARRRLGESRRAWPIVVVFLGVTLGLSAQTPQQAPPGGVPPGQAKKYAAAELLLQFRPDASEASKADAREAVNGRRKQGLRRKTDTDGELEVVILGQGMSVENAARLLARHPAVTIAEPNYLVTHQVISTDPSYVDGSLWGLYGVTGNPTTQGSGPPAIGPYGTAASAAWSAGYTGSSAVIVAVMDEGIDYTHPDLAQNIWTNPFDVPDGKDNDFNGFIDDIHGWDFVINDNSVYDCLLQGDGGTGACGGSVDSHGTHIAGTIGARANAFGVVGINWSVKIISLKFLSATGGYASNAIKGLDYLVDLKARHGLNIVAVNNSWGGGGYSRAMHEAILRAAKAGILFIAAAGNYGNNNDAGQYYAFYPSHYSSLVGTATVPAATYDSVIAVASLDSTGARSGFSNYGLTSVDLAAPGGGILSTTPRGTYSLKSGTSMATPHVTGAVALYAAMHPGVTPAAMRDAILASAAATPTPSMAGLTVTGGRLNMATWVSAAPPPPDEPPPPPVDDPPIEPPPPPPPCGAKGCDVHPPPPPCGKSCP